MNEDNFQKLVKSILYIFGGILFFGALLDAIANSLELINLEIAAVLSIIILLVWVYLKKWIATNKPFWGAGKNKVRLTKPNRQINLFMIGIIFVLWISIFFQTEESENLRNAITVQKTDIEIKKFKPNSEINFLLTHHLKNHSKTPLKNYQFTNYCFVFNKNWQLDTFVRTNLHDHKSYLVQPGHEFKINDDMFNWNSNTNTLRINRFVGVIVHDFTDEKEKNSFKNREYYCLVHDTLRNQLRIVVPSDSTVNIVEDVINSTINNEIKERRKANNG